MASNGNGDAPSLTLDDFHTEDAALTEQIRKNQGAVFAEDEVVLAAQQQSLLRYPDRRLVNLDIDRGGSQVRKVIARLAQAEAVQEPRRRGPHPEIR